MRRFALLLIFALLCAASVSAGIDDGPVATLLFNRVEQVVVYDNYAVGLADRVFSVSRWDSGLVAFVPERVFENDLIPLRFKRNDSLLLVATVDGRIAAYDLNRLPDLEPLWVAQPGIEFADFDFDGKDLFLAAWFHGLWRFHVDPAGGTTFADSSMTGVLMTQLDVRGDRLFALDQYNGIMRYDLTAPGFGRFIDYLYSSREIASYRLDDTTAIMVARGGGLLFGRFGTAPAVTSTLEGIAQPQQVLLTDSLIVLVTPRLITTLNRTDHTVIDSALTPTVQPNGQIVRVKGRDHLLLPALSGGLVLYDLSDLYNRRPGLYRSGPIQALAMAGGRLFTGGGNNPIDVYAFDSVVTPRLDYTMYPGLTRVQDLVTVGDTVLAYFAGLNKIAFILDALSPDSFYLERSFHLEDTLTSRLLFLPNKIDTSRVLVTVGENSFQPYAISDSGTITPMPAWRLHSRISAAEIHDTILFAGTVKRQLWVYAIDSGLTISSQAVLDLSGIARVVAWVNGHLLLFVNNSMLSYALTDAFDLEFQREDVLPISVTDIRLANDKMYAVGPEGIGIFSLENGIPELSQFGGRGGAKIAVEGHVLATTDGGSINIYRLEDEETPTPQPSLPRSFAVRQNYPNPVNAGTVIEYSLSATSRVEITIFNVLGQRVRKLVDVVRPAGTYQASWDGTNASGESVATGIYYYRFKAGDINETRKMVLLK